MLKFTKRLILNLYYLPALCRTAWKYQQGNWYVFRDESDVFLEYVVYKGASKGTEYNEDIQCYVGHARVEMQVRSIVEGRAIGG